MKTLKELETTLQMRKGLPPLERRRELREAAGATLAQVAEVCGVSAQAVLEWERGVGPGVDNLAAYSRVLHMFAELAHDDGAGLKEVPKTGAAPLT